MTEYSAIRGTSSNGSVSCKLVIKVSGCPCGRRRSINQFESLIFFYFTSPPGHSVSSLAFDKMENSTVNDEAGHQGAPENPVQKVFSSESNWNTAQVSNKTEDLRAKFFFLSVNWLLNHVMSSLLTRWAVSWRQVNFLPDGSPRQILLHPGLQ